MQEQPHYNITPEQGWSKMRPALDHAMPANRPSRRFGFLWWSTSAVLMSGVVGLFVFKGANFFTQYPTTTLPLMESVKKNTSGNIDSQDESKIFDSKVNINSSIPSAIETEQKNKTTKKEATKNSIPSLKTIVPAKKNTKDKQTEPIAAAIAPLDNEVVSINTTIASTNSIAAAEPISNVEKSDDQEAVANTSMTNAPVNELLFVLSTSDVTATQSGVIPFQIVEALPGLNASCIPSEDSASDIVYAGSVSKARTSTPFIEPNLAVSGLVGLNGGLGGTASAGADLNVSRRVSITTGLGYMVYTPNASVFGSSLDLASNTEFNAILNYDPTYEGINTYVDGTSVNSSAGYNVINPLVENLRQWQVSAGLKWKMSGRFYIDGGVTIGFGTTAYSEYPIVSGDPLSQTPYVKIGNSLNTYDVIRSTMTSIYGGIGYNAGKHFDVFAQWTHGFDSYILSEPGNPNADLDVDSRTDYIRGLNLGLRYTL